MENQITFTLEEVKKLVINAYEVGFSDGVNSVDDENNEDFKEYKNANDFWAKNCKNWLTKDINYIID